MGNIGIDSWIRPHGIGTPESYAFPDPTTEHMENAIDHARSFPELLTRADQIALAEMAESYHHLLTHPAGTGSVVRQLRELRRELKRRADDDRS
jgi:hypothetical protein